MSKIMVYHRPNARFSIGIEVDDNGDVFGALSACHWRDSWNRKIGYKKVVCRLSSNSHKFYLGHYDGDIGVLFRRMRHTVDFFDEKRNVSSIPSALMHSLRLLNVFPTISYNKKTVSN